MPVRVTGTKWTSGRASGGMARTVSTLVTPTEVTSTRALSRGGLSQEEGWRPRDIDIGRDYANLFTSPC